MSAYVIAEIDVHDPEAYEGYKSLSGPSAAPFGGEFVVRGGAAEALEGDPPARIVVLRFPSIDAAREWYASPLYQEALAIRQQAATGRLLLVEGT